MKAFTYQEGTSAAEATRAVARQPNAMFLAGGTTMVDLIKIDVLTPDTLIPIGHLELAEIEDCKVSVPISGNVPAASANRVYHTSGLRVRSLPISLEELLVA